MSHGKETENRHEKIVICNCHALGSDFRHFQSFEQYYIENVLLIAFVEFIVSQVYSHFMQDYMFWHFLETVENSVL